MNPIRLGVANGRVQNSQITASSFNAGGTKSFYGRLDGVPTSGNQAIWRANNQDSNPWIQVDFLRPVTVTGILTQGRKDQNHYVTEYELKYSDDGILWTKYPEVCGYLCFVEELFPQYRLVGSHLTDS